MATLKEMSAEMARIKAELQRMEDDDSVTDESDGDARDTLIERWEELDEATKPLIARMEKVRGITRAAADPANVEDGADPGNSEVQRYGGGRGPEVINRRYTDPYGDLQAVRQHLVRTPELRGRAFDSIELEVRRGNLAHEFGENVHRMVQDNPGTLGRGIAEHVLLTGSEDYQEAFRAYLEDPQGEAQRAAMSLTLANGGYLLPYVLDQVPVA